MTRSRATFIGFAAILLWSLLALLTVRTDPVPPLQLNAMTFALGGAIGIVWVWMTGEVRALTEVSWRVYAFGSLALFAYHFLYFSALRMAPAAEAGLIAYLWPMLIVLFSGLLPGEKVRAMHVVGAMIAFAGVALIVLKTGLRLEGSALSGYGLALLCALTWSGYSVISRRLASVPTAAVAVFCLVTAALSAVAHLMMEPTVWPETGSGWIAVALLGLGPVGAAFYVWDIGVKRGNIQFLGVASYAAPLLSTAALIAFGASKPTWTLAVAAILVAGGAALAARSGRAAQVGKDKVRRR